MLQALHYEARDVRQSCRMETRESQGVTDCTARLTCRSERDRLFREVAAPVRAGSAKAGPVVVAVLRMLVDVRTLTLLRGDGTRQPNPPAARRVRAVEADLENRGVVTTDRMRTRKSHVQVDVLRKTERIGIAAGSLEEAPAIEHRTGNP